MQTAVALLMAAVSVAVTLVSDPVLNLMLCGVLAVLLVAHLLQISGRGQTAVAPTLKADVKSAIAPSGESEIGIVLVDAGGKRIAVTKCLRAVYNLGLRDAWQMVEHTPSIIRLDATVQEAQHVAARLGACGATVRLVKRGEEAE
jgi:ribosomal protein L7/L12